jgi:Ras-related protein Rab-8A
MSVAVKIVVIGDSGVGKSSFLLVYSEDRFSPSYITTIGVDFKLKTIDVNGTPTTLQIWDTAGQERFRTIALSYYRNAEGAILMFDVTNENSFTHMRDWSSQLDMHGIHGVKKMLVANKCDRMDRKVSQTQGLAMASEIGADYIEASAMNNTNIKETFQKLAGKVL